MKQIGWLVNALVQDPMGPGFESQVHQNFVVFFLQVSTCSASGRDYHTSSGLNVPGGSQADPMAKDGGSP